MEFRQTEMLKKYAELREKYIDPYEPDLSEAPYTVRYAKIPGPCLPSDLCSHRVLQHFEAKKALFPRLFKKLPQGANAQEYAVLYFDRDETLHHLEFQMDAARRYLTVPLSGQLQADFEVRIWEAGRKPFVTFLSMEWTEYGDDGRPVSVESFRRNGSLADGVIINSEYYQYENGKMIHADRFDSFDSDFQSGGLVLRFVPDRIMNPEVFAYDFEPAEGGVLCTRTNFWSKSKTYTQSFLMPQKELQKMEENGIRCFL